MATQQKGFSIFFDDDQDMQDLLEFCKWKAAKAQSKFASIDTDFDLQEANSLIRQHRLEETKRREAQAQQAQAVAIVGQQRESVSTLPDWKAQEELDRQAAEEMRLQGELYAASRNSGKQGKVYITEEDRSIRDGVVSWIDRMRKRGHRL